MPNVISILATFLLVALIALWTYFAVSLGPRLWRTARWKFFLCLVGAGLLHLWFAVDIVYSGRMEGHEVAAQVAATVVAAIVAVVGSIIGAMLGAKEGAKATHDATMIAIDADAKVAQQRRDEEDRAALLALVAECRSNATTLRTDKEIYPDPRFLVPLRQGAFDAAASAIAGLDRETQLLAQRAASELAWFNQLVTGRLIALNVSLAAGGRETHEPAYAAEMEPLAESLPSLLDDLAGRIESKFELE